MKSAIWKENPQQIFLVFSTDEWNSEPMTLRAAATTEDGIVKCVHELIREGEMDYLPESEDDLSRDDQIALFDRDWPKLPRDQINWNLKMGYVDTTYDSDLYR